jgi:RNA polymerase sigma-70 factor (ECF subfamily)
MVALVEGMTSDQDLLEDVLRGDGRAWQELLRRYRGLIYRCIARVIARGGFRGRADMDEVYAEILLQLVRDDMRKLRAYDPGRGVKLGTWIGMIAGNAAYDFLRGAARRPMLDRDDDAAVEVGDTRERGPLAMLIEKERWRHANALLGGLTERDRRFVELYYRRGLDADEVAAEMQISRKTVYSKKHKIRAQLARALEERSEDSALADLAEAA